MKKILCCFSLALFFWSCTKESNSNLVQQADLQEIQTATTESGRYYYEDPDNCFDCRKYTEYTCTVGNKIGTMCDDTKGDCKKKDCEAVSTYAKIGGHLSDAEIEQISTQHATRLVKTGYIEQQSFERSKSLVKKALLTNNKK